jgi:hypothetical protein
MRTQDDGPLRYLFRYEFDICAIQALPQEIEKIGCAQERPIADHLLGNDTATVTAAH